MTGKFELVRSSTPYDWASISIRTGRLPPGHWEGNGQALARLYPHHRLGHPARLVVGRRAARAERGALRFDLLHPLHGHRLVELEAGFFAIANAHFCGAKFTCRLRDVPTV